MTSDFFDASLKTESSVRALISNQQLDFQKVRGSSALATMVATGYITIRKIIENADARTQAAILDEHGVAPASDATSKYTPWIKVQWGEPHLENAKFIDSQGDERTVWVPDRSMEIYHHAMEDLEARGIETTDPQVVADAIMSCGGAAKMSQDRKKRLNQQAREASTAVYENKRKTFLDETHGPLVDIPLDRPEGAGDFMTLLVRNIPDSTGYEVLGIVSANAVRDLDRMAADQSEAIQQRIKARRDDAEREARDNRIREEERNRIVGGLDGDARRALIAKVYGARETAAPNADEQAA